MIVLFIFVASVSGLLLWLVYCLTPIHDPDEPPLIPTSVPVLGHLYGMLRSGSRYYDKIS